MSTAFEILVGGRAEYAAFPHNGALAIESDGKIARCVLGCLAHAGGMEDAILKEANNEVDNYVDILDDKNGIDLAIRLLADQIVIFVEGDGMGAVQEWGEENKIESPTLEAYLDYLHGLWDDDKNFMYEVVYDFNDTYTKDGRVYDGRNEKWVNRKVDPAPEVLEVMDAAIAVAGKL